MNNRRPRGFTITELLVVLGVLLLAAAALLPSIGPLRRKGRMRLGAARLAGTLRLARSLAIANSACYQLRGDASGETVKLHVYSGRADPPQPGDLYATVELPAAVGVDASGPPLPAFFYFWPDGSASGSLEVVLVHRDDAREKRRVEVRRASGAVRVVGSAL